MFRFTRTTKIRPFSYQDLIYFYLTTKSPMQYPTIGILLHTWLTNIPAVARDSSARLTISSPLEAHKSYAILFHMVGVDVGFENPTFACLELDYEDADQDSTGEALKQAQQTLTYYELDLGMLFTRLG